MSTAACLLFATLPLPLASADEPFTLEEVRGAYLRHVAARRLEEAASALEAVQGRVAPETGSTLTLDRALLAELRAAFASLGQRVAVGERFPAALGKTTRVRGTVGEADESGFTVVDRGKETRLRWEELDWGDVAEFLGRPGGAEGETAPQRRVAGWLFVLAGEAEKGWKWIEEAGRDEGGEGSAAALLAARPSFEAAMREAEALAVFDAGADPVVEKALGEGLDARLFETATYRRRRADLIPTVRAALETRFDRGGKKEIFRGSLAEEGGGGVKIAYDFAEGADIEDWEVGPYPALENGPWPSDVSTGDPAEAHHWRVEGGKLVGAGTAIAKYRAKFSGSMALSFTVHLKPFQKGKKKDPAVDQLFLPAILDNGKGHYLTAQSGNHLYWIAGTRPVDLGESIPGTPAVLFNKDTKVRLEWKDGVARVFVNGAKCGEAEFRELLGGSAFLFFKGPLKVSVDDLVLEGTLDPDWLAQERARWIEAALARALP
jgi:hypothetical protein